MDRNGPGITARLLRGAASIAAGSVVTLAVFLVLPVMQVIGNPAGREMMVRGVEVVNLQPPPPPPPEVEEEEEEPPEPPQELEAEAPPLELSQLELALNPGFGDGGFGDFGVKLLEQMADGTGSEEMDKVFSLADLDQRPRVLIQTMPRYPAELRRKKVAGTVHVIFTVDRRGRVLQPRVEKSTNPAFEKPAVDAVKQWKFEPGTRKGEKVQFKMRIPITFNAG